MYSAVGWSIGASLLVGILTVIDLVVTDIWDLESAEISSNLMYCYLGEYDE